MLKGFCMLKMYSQYSTKGKITGGVNGGGSSNESSSSNSSNATSAEIKALELAIASMQTSISTASGVTSKMNQLSNKVEVLESRNVSVTNKYDVNTKNTVYGTGYINELEEKLFKNSAESIVEGAEDDVVTVKCLRKIENIEKIPEVVHDYTEPEGDSNAVYGIGYVNEVLQRIPTPMNDMGISEDINPLMYTADYIDGKMPEVLDEKDTLESRKNVYSTHYINDVLTTLMSRISALEAKLK